MSGAVILGGQVESKRPMADPWPDGRVLVNDPNFNDGYRGWRGHMSSNVPQAPISLTRDGLFGRALLLSTGTLRSSTAAANCTALKRISRNVETGVLYAESVWSFTAENLPTAAVGAADANAQPAQFDFGFDTQKYNNPANGRSFAKFRYSLFDNTSQNRINQFRYVDDAGVPQDISGAVIDLGPNENKANAWYVRIAFDLGANSGLGGYKELVVGEPAGGSSYVFDLSGTGQRGAQANQTTSSFSGGLNAYLALTNRNTADNGHASMVVHRYRCFLG